MIKYGFIISISITITFGSYIKTVDCIAIKYGIENHWKYISYTQLKKAKFDLEKQIFTHNKTGMWMNTTFGPDPAPGKSKRLEIYLAEPYKILIFSENSKTPTIQVPLQKLYVHHKVPYMSSHTLTISDGTTSTVEIDIKNNIVKKHVKQYLNYDVFEREVMWLHALKDWKRIPRLHYADFTTKTIYMSYVGTRLHKRNLPKNWQQQIKTLIQELAWYKVHHNDIKPTELLVYNNILHIIDFGWATPSHIDIRTKNWPPQLGASFKCGNTFNDSCSIYQVIQHIRN